MPDDHPLYQCPLSGTWIPCVCEVCEQERVTRGCPRCGYSRDAHASDGRCLLPTPLPSPSSGR